MNIQKMTMQITVIRMRLPKVFMARLPRLRSPLIPRPHPARHALQSTTSDRPHAIGFYCRLTCGGSTFSIELGPSRNTRIHVSETECSPGSLTLSLAERITRGRSSRHRHSHDSQGKHHATHFQSPPFPFRLRFVGR